MVIEKLHARDSLHEAGGLQIYNNEPHELNIRNNRL